MEERHDGDITIEEIRERIEEVKARKELPIFEWHVTMFSMGMSILLFMFPEMLSSNNNANLYEIMLRIMPQFMWAFAFTGAGLVKAVGLLTGANSLRILGLSMSVFLYLVMTICYSVNFPAIGAVSFGSMALFSLVSIFMVKHTG